MGRASSVSYTHLDVYKRQEKHVAAVAKELGGQITVKAFTRFATGEGIEKKEDDFAAEVASMIH